MGADTAISWTRSTFNPWHGCSKVSPGCDHCYAEAFSVRIGQKIWGPDADRRFFGDKHWAEPLKWERKAAAGEVPWRVFCASMCDVFELNPLLTGERSRLWELIDTCPHLTWQLLTKRPENVVRLAPDRWLADWPPNVWLGTTVEDQTRANLRIPRLLAIAGVTVRFLSVEPMLEPVDLSEWLYLEWMDALRMPGAPPTFRTEDGEGGWGAEMFAALQGRRPEIGWVICGGESGGQRRPFDHGWARDLRDQCDAAEVPYFFKQDTGLYPGTPGPDDLAVCKAFPA